MRDFTWVQPIRATVMPSNQILPTIHRKPPLRIHTRVSRSAWVAPGKASGHTQGHCSLAQPSREGKLLQLLQGPSTRWTKAALALPGCSEKGAGPWCTHCLRGRMHNSPCLPANAKPACIIQVWRLSHGEHTLTLQAAHQMKPFRNLVLH